MVKFKRFLSILCVLAMILGLAACGSSSDSDDTEEEETSTESTSAEAEEAAEAEDEEDTSSSDDSSSDSEKIFRYSILTEPTTLDPNKANSVIDNTMLHACQEGLVRTTAGEITPGVAESWEISEDGLTYTFYLREDAYWSDGVQITANDFVYGMQRLVDPETASVYAYIGEIIVNGYEVETGELDPSELGVTAVDDFTLVIELEYSAPYFLSMLGGNVQFSPIRQDIVEEYGVDFAGTAETNVYSGPFQIVSTDDQAWTYARNEYYWDYDSINLDGCEITLVADANTALALYESGELDYVLLDNDAVALYDDIDDSMASGSMRFLYMKVDGTTNPLLANENFRLALSYALDRNTLNTLATNGVWSASNRFVLPILSGASGTTYGEEYPLETLSVDGDTEKALEYLALAMEEEGVSDASDITIDLTTYDDEDAKLYAEVIQELWTTTLGINVTVTQVTYSELYGSVLPNGDFEVSFGSWSPDYDDPYTYLEIFTANYYDTGFDSEEYSDLLAEARVETDEVARMELLFEAEQMLVNQAIVIPTLMVTNHYLLSDRVTGVEFYFLSVQIDWIYADIVE